MLNGLMVQLIEFQDGSYSRGPVDIPVGELDDSKYYISPTFKFEQVSYHGTDSHFQLSTWLISIIFCNR